MKDYYNILGVSKNASVDEINAAYRSLARKYHPDVNKDPDAVDKFKAVTEAYEVLSDKDKRAQHDNPFPFGNMGNFFSQMFAGAAARQHRSHPSNLDVHYRLNIDFLEAANGCAKDVEIPLKELCKTCGAVGWMKVEKCFVCNGVGQVAQQQGHWSLQRDCSKCNGTGNIPSDKCKDCDGGFISKGSETVSIKIPMAAESGLTLGMTGKGQYGRSGSRGDLYVTIAVKPHDFINRIRNSLDLLCEVPVTYTQLVLGGSINVPGLRADLSAKILPGTQPGGKLVLRGQGLTNKRGRKGSLIVVLIYSIPKNLPKEYTKKLKELALLEKKYPSKEVSEFKARLDI